LQINIVLSWKMIYNNSNFYCLLHITRGKLDIGGLTVNVAVIYGTGNARKMIDKVRSSDKP